MKQVILSFVFVLFTVVGVTAQENGEKAEGPQIKFEEEVIDYGTVEKGGDGVRNFKFTNTGTKPLIINNARGSCGCTVPTWPRQPIKPGEEDVIKVKYDTKRLGPINKSVTLTTNDPDNPTKVLRIKGKVIAPKTSPEKETPEGAPVEK